MFKPLAVLITSLSLLLLGSNPVMADASSSRDGMVKIVSPEDGNTYQAGTISTVSVQFDGAEAGTYQLSIFGNYCDDGTRYDHRQDFDYSGGSQVLTLTVPTVSCAGYFDVYVYNKTGYSNTVSSSFTTTRPAAPPKIYEFSLSARAFYPTVTDGFKDSIDITGGSEELDPAVIEIVSPSGRVVKSWKSDIGSLYVSWAGRDSAGRAVSKGVYRVRLTITNADGESVSSTKNVEVKREYSVGTFTDARKGVDSVVRQRRGDCYFYATPNYSPKLDIQCLGGASNATVRYVFPTRKDARNISWKMEGKVGCCMGGVIQQTGKRLSKSRYEVTLRVSGYRAYTVRKLSFRYNSNKWW